MRRFQGLRRWVLGLGLVAWGAFAFWLFSFAFSSSFFRWNLAARLGPFVGAWLAAVAMPAAGAWELAGYVRGRRGALAAWLRHLGWTVLAFVPFLAVTALQRRLPDPFRLSADDSMGVGIDFLILLVLAAGFVCAESAALAGLVARRRARLGSEGETG
ncbi:MAG TPA: hypothetical protein VLA66_14840 [Thermoanaerobaculia bacterium]|nr:hypothetical protein [Thermoanaerobaculia bacterium]